VTDQGPKLIYETVHGSRAFGLALPSSDLDMKGVVVGPRAWYFSYRGGPEQIMLSADHVRYELRKFMQLAVAANPSIFEVLFAPDQHHRVVTPAGMRLLENRDKFLSQRVAGTFGGYALSQLKRIRTHRRWLLEPPGGAPTRAQFGLPATTTLPNDQLGALDALASSGTLDTGLLTPNFLKLLDSERAYRAARTEWDQYRHWTKNRNPARAALEARFGYDTKHALHLVRLLRMGVEILESGLVHVHRTDREELLRIRAGEWSYEYLCEYAEEMRLRLESAKAETRLPHEPPEAELTELCVALVDDCLRELG